MPLLKQLGTIVLALILLAIVFVAKGGDVHSLLRDLGLSAAPGEAPMPGDASPGPRTTSDREAGGLGSELEPFITCINRVDAAMRSNFGRYRQTFPAAFDGGAIYHTGFKIAPYDIDDRFSKNCIAGLRAAGNAAQLEVELRDLALRYADALEALVPVMNQTDEYLSQETYRDDDWHGMRAELHPKIVALFATFLGASDRMRVGVAAANIAATRRELGLIEGRDGRSYRWHELNLIYQARLSYDETLEAAGSGKVQTGDVVKAERALEDAWNAARGYMAAQPSVTTELGNKLILFHIEERVADVLKAIKTVRRNAVTGDNRSLEMNLSRLTEAFSGLVDDFNQRTRNGQ